MKKNKKKTFYQVIGDTHKIYDVPSYDKGFIKSLKAEGYPIFTSNDIRKKYQKKKFGTKYSTHIY